MFVSELEQDASIVINARLSRCCWHFTWSMFARGSTGAANLAWSCQRCKASKGPNLSSVDPDTGGIVELFNPREDGWQEHFRWEDLRIQGKTAKGRATAWLLEMNSDERIRWRGILRKHGLF
jgi:hypothetical protein